MTSEDTDMGAGLLLERTYKWCNPREGHYGPRTPRPKSRHVPRLWNPEEEETPEDRERK